MWQLKYYGKLLRNYLPWSFILLLGSTHSLSYLLLFPLLFFFFLGRGQTGGETESCYMQTATFACWSSYSRCWQCPPFQRLWNTKCIFWISFCFITAGKNNLKQHSGKFIKCTSLPLLLVPILWFLRAPLPLRYCWSWFGIIILFIFLFKLYSVKVCIPSWENNSAFVVVESYALHRIKTTNSISSLDCRDVKQQLQLL